ncbi:MAG: transcription elongation factor subunit Spt4 [archaeon]
MKACKNCKYLTSEEKCPACGSTDLTPYWKGRIIVVNPEKSEVSKKLNLSLPGEYALRIVK